MISDIRTTISTIPALHIDIGKIAIAVS